MGNASPQHVVSSGDGNEWRQAAASHQKFSSSASPKLAVSATSWTATQRSGLEDSTDSSQQKDEEVARSIKAILNKLTIEKFDALYEKLINCGICKDSHIELLVHEVFDKACVQHHFVDMYADLCMRLEGWLDGVGADATATGFRRILLHQCQNSFEESLQNHEDLAPGMSDDDRMEAEIKNKQRALGNTRLVGALLNRGMLSPRVLLSCANDLLKDPSALHALESLTVLLTAVGPTFDDKEWSHYSLFCGIFDKVVALSKNKDVPPRTRFLLQDLLELRATKWSSAKTATKQFDAPMKIEEVHRQAALEEKKQLKMNSIKKNGLTTNDKQQKGLAESGKTSKSHKTKYSPKQKIDSQELHLKPKWSDNTPPPSPPHGPRKDPKAVVKDQHAKMSTKWSSDTGPQNLQKGSRISRRTRKSGSW
jgi:hypothetical protein